MPVAALAKKAIVGIEVGNLVIRLGQINLLKVLSRVAPEFAFKQLTSLTRPK